MFTCTSIAPVLEKKMKRRKWKFVFVVFIFDIYIMCSIDIVYLSYFMFMKYSHTLLLYVSVQVARSAKR